MKSLSRLYTVLIFLFLYAPIAVLIVYSFNGSSSTVVLSGFSLKWYKMLLADRTTLKAFYNTLILAVTSSLSATVIGTAASVGIEKFRKSAFRSSLMAVTNIPMMDPEIVTGVSMMLLFVFIGRIIRTTSVLGFGTLLIAHITFNLPYVILTVLPKLRQTDKNLSEAAQDLGCKPVSAFFKVIIPAIMPGIITGMIMAFTLSLDDFIISYFTSGPGFQTLPIVIYSMTKKRVKPDMYALSALIFVSILILLILYNIVQQKSEERNSKVRQ
ncbi:MAG: ABC transporter permease [Clostridia bacterium]|nr:ABC transporter permease [Clostridia bacterium]